MYVDEVAVISPISANVNVVLYVAPKPRVWRLCVCHIVQVDGIVIAMSHLADCGVNTLNALKPDNTT